METNGGSWTQTYAYDAQGNRAVVAGSWVPNTAETPQVPTAQSALPYTNNRWVGASYDTAGNVMLVNGKSFSYDAENRQQSASASGTTTYEYDGEGRRVKKVSGGTTTAYVYDALGSLAAEYTTQAVVGPVVVSYVTPDHLGSARVVTSAAGTVAARYDYLPSGEEIAAGVLGRTTGMGYRDGVGPDAWKEKFTDKERDSESGLDYFLARYHSGAQGRFTSVDPIWITKERMLDPQRLNLYAYGRNNPLRYVDPDGMDITLGRCDVGSTEDCFARLQQGLKKEDRSHVRLAQGDGRNGFKKGEYGVVVDADYKSDSKNFQTLQRLANDHSATATIDVLKGDSRFDLKVSVRVDVRAGEETFATMGTTPNEAGGFTGYTFYPQGRGVPGPYSTGSFTDVVVNAGRGWIPATIHHELRHVLLGDFGRVAPYGAHGTGRVDRETVEAEKEAVKNQVEVLRNQR